MVGNLGEQLAFMLLRCITSANCNDSLIEGGLKLFSFIPIQKCYTKLAPGIVVITAPSSHLFWGVLTFFGAHRDICGRPQESDVWLIDRDVLEMVGILWSYAVRNPLNMKNREVSILHAFEV